jgi:VanZ family protein
MKPFIKYWLPLLIWMALISVASSDLMSSSQTSRFLIPFLRWLKPDILPETLEQIHFWWRKTGHLFEYAMLGVLMIRAFRGERKRTNNNAQRPTSNAQRSKKNLFTSAWIGSTIFAVLDEFHQSFVVSRGAAVGDVMIDSIGAALGLLFYAILTRWRLSRSGFQPL